jgi:protein gp37
MATNSSIEWTEATWNPVTGCSKVSPGCQHCYAERMAKRLQAMGQSNYSRGFKVTLQEHMLTVPLTWRRPKRIFVNSMSDLFHESVPADFIHRVSTRTRCLPSEAGVCWNSIPTSSRAHTCGWA